MSPSAPPLRGFAGLGRLQRACCCLVSLLALLVAWQLLPVSSSAGWLTAVWLFGLPSLLISCAACTFYNRLVRERARRRLAGARLASLSTPAGEPSSAFVPHPIDKSPT